MSENTQDVSTNHDEREERIKPRGKSLCVSIDPFLVVFVGAYKRLY